ncbi:MAG: hypothetical protein R3321_06085 [Nitrososphaeraceae archaeon]|nr:hypothetical protein [Nitrososphaeraceae archaeon]
MDHQSEKDIFAWFCYIISIILVFTIISNNHTSNKISLIFAEPDNKDKKSDGKDKEKTKTITHDKNKDTEKEEKDKKKKDKKKEKKSNYNLEKKGKGNKEKYDISWTHTDQDLILKYNYRNLDIPKIYQTAPDGQTYNFNKTNPNDKEQVNKEDKSNVFTKQNKDGSWRIDFGRPRIDIHTKDAGILPDDPVKLNNMSLGKIQSWNYSELKDTGYWYKPTDWKNIETTLIFKLLDSSRSEKEHHAISIVSRSITHAQLDNEYKKSSDEPQFFCGGSSYHNNLSDDGNVRMKKEQFHIDYEWERYNESLNVGDLYEKIIGLKGIVYNINETAVKLETWVDTENGGKGPYKKIHEMIDNGDWGDNMKKCGAKTDGQAITWGSPIVILKANDFKFDIYDIEIREIVPPNSQKNTFPTRIA